MSPLPADGERTGTLARTAIGRAKGNGKQLKQDKTEGRGARHCQQYIFPVKSPINLHFFPIDGRSKIMLPEQHILSKDEWLFCVSDLSALANCPATLPSSWMGMADGRSAIAFPPLRSHRAGAETARKIVRHAAELGIGYLTFIPFLRKLAAPTGMGGRSDGVVALLPQEPFERFNGKWR